MKDPNTVLDLCIEFQLENLRPLNSSNFLLFTLMHFISPKLNSMGYSKINNNILSLFLILNPYIIPQNMSLKDINSIFMWNHRASFIPIKIQGLMISCVHNIFPIMRQLVS